MARLHEEALHDVDTDTDSNVGFTRCTTCSTLFLDRVSVNREGAFICTPRGYLEAAWKGD